MSVGFGFSAGDFIAALELVATVVDALRESGEASHKYRELVRQLYTLETALLQVKRLEFDESQHAEYIALQQAASQCQRTIDDFWKKIEKYQGSLGAGGATSRLKKGWMKIRWAICRKEDVSAFQADLVAHTESIHLLLVAIEMSRTNIIEKKNDKTKLSLASKVQQAYFKCMKKLSEIAETASITRQKSYIDNFKDIIVLNIQNIITKIPAQVERQQPVYLIDALGKFSPFHLEFIRSAEALTAVLQSNVNKAGQARKKIQKGEFVIQNSVTGRDINIFDDWQSCFYPGQRVEMSLVFQQRWQTGNSCPGCGYECAGSTDSDVKCPACDITFRRIIKIEDDKEVCKSCNQEKIPEAGVEEKPLLAAIAPLQLLDSTLDTNTSPSAIEERQNPSPSMAGNVSGSGKRKREYAGDNELGLELHQDNIRRVRVQTLSRGITKRCRAFFGYFEEEGRPEPAFCYGFRTSEDESCLIVEFEDTKNAALCETINEQAFKQGGLFQTELVEAESDQSIVEDDSLQITWLEQDEVQMYLRFQKATDRDLIWEFISSAVARWKMRAGPSIIPMPFMSLDPETSRPTLAEIVRNERLSFENPSSGNIGYWNEQPPQFGSSLGKSPNCDMGLPLPSMGPPSLHQHQQLFPPLAESRPIQRQHFEQLPRYSERPESENDTIAMKRARNTLAARKSRNRKLKKLEQLGEEIAKLEAERDHWKNLVVKLNENERGKISESL
ncbi:hypothetical protein G7Y89_g10823 [Cudoniella acicularis]|uniref:BZIP domain-containing protein n=1 Tax=Cudoniella acicularis TaxID=354080 RepID=A0A8H4RC14_9HELO|nr:hypothetical protein G7Y89_g10823 [Cudoniella acicularis]